MNKEDFERLKAVCEKEGFKLLKSLPDKDVNFHILAVSKKDIWDGVEYGCWTQSDSEFFIKGKTYRFFNQFDHTYSEIGRQHFTNEVWVKSNFVPSTESAYIEQLKKEANSRGIIDICSLDISMMSGGQLHNKWTEYIYRKDTDTLYFHGVPVYQQGKWATQANERVEVEFGWTEKKIALMKTPVALFTNKSTKKSIFDGKTSNEICDIFTFLASQLEKYLNGEIE